MNCKLTALMGAAAGAAAGHAYNKPLGMNMPTPAYLLQAATFVVSCVCVCVCDSTAANTAHELPLLTSGCMANLRGSSRKKPILWERLWEGACQCQWEARAGCSAWLEPGVQLNPHGGARSSVVIVCYRYSIADDSFYAQLPAAFARN